MEIEKYIMTPELKSKWSFLTHIKLGACFYFVELDLNDILSKKTLDKYEDSLVKRQDNRDYQREEEEYYHKIVEIENKQNEKKRRESKDSHSDNHLKSKNYIEFNQSEQEALNEYHEYMTKNLESPGNKTTSGESTSDAKIAKKISYLLEGKTIEMYEKEEKERQKKEDKKFVYSKEEFPDLEDDIDHELTEKKLKKAGAGGRNKKKKFVDMK